MSTGEESYASRDDGSARPSFELALRGYDKRQVDRYVEQMDGALSTLTAERAQAAGQIQGLTTHIQRLQAELTELRQRPAQVDRASFRDLGPMVDQILALAEKQAAVITDSATQRANQLQGEAEKTLVEARDRTAQALRDLDEELAARRDEQEKAYEERRTAADAELAEIRERAERLRAEGRPPTSGPSRRPSGSASRLRSRSPRPGPPPRR